MELATKEIVIFPSLLANNRNSPLRFISLEEIQLLNDISTSRFPRTRGNLLSESSKSGARWCKCSKISRTVREIQSYLDFTLVRICEALMSQNLHRKLKFYRKLLLTKILFPRVNFNVTKNLDGKEHGYLFEKVDVSLIATTLSNNKFTSGISCDRIRTYELNKTTSKNTVRRYCRVLLVLWSNNMNFRLYEYATERTTPTIFV